MQKVVDVFYSRYDTLDNFITKTQGNKGINEKNKDEFIWFLKHCIAEDLSFARVRKYYSTFNKIFRLAKYEFDLKDATEADLKDLLVEINIDACAENTKKGLRSALKKYYKVRNHGRVPEKAMWICTSVKKHRRKLPEELLTKEEIDKIIRACSNERDRCFVMMLYEGGFRIGEIASLCQKHCIFTQQGVSIQIPEGKTGARRVLLLESEIYLRNWIKVHPMGENPSAHLWVRMRGSSGRLTYGTISKMLHEKAEKAGVDPKKVHPHNFRHSRATHMAQHLTEAQMCAYFGWVMGSDMTATYVHLSGRDLDKIIMEMHGLKNEAKPQTPKICHRCGKENPASMKYCGVCQAPLTIDVALEKKEEPQESQQVLAQQLLANPEIQKALLQLLGKGLSGQMESTG